MKKYIAAVLVLLMLCNVSATLAMAEKQSSEPVKNEQQSEGGYLDKETGKFWTQEELDALPKYSTPDPKVWPLPPQTVAEKKELLNKLLTLHAPPYQYGFDEKICKGLFNALRDGTAEILEPEFVTQSMADPRMKKVTDKCPKLYLDKYWGYKSELDAKTAAEPGRGPEDWDWLAVEHGQAYANFALFKFDPKLTGGADYAFFAEAWGTHGMYGRGGNAGGGKVFNARTCKISNRFSGAARYHPPINTHLSKGIEWEDPIPYGFVKTENAYYWFSTLASPAHLKPEAITGRWSSKTPYMSIWKLGSELSGRKACIFNTPLRTTPPAELEPKPTTNQGEIK